jgi:hypothetical protein
MSAWLANSRRLRLVRNGEFQKPLQDKLLRGFFHDGPCTRRTALLWYNGAVPGSVWYKSWYKRGDTWGGATVILLGDPAILAGLPTFPDPTKAEILTIARAAAGAGGNSTNDDDSETSA